MKSIKMLLLVVILNMFLVMPVSWADDTVSSDDSLDKAMGSDLIYPTKITVMNGMDYVMDQGNLDQVTNSTTTTLAKVGDLYPVFHKYGIRKTDLPTFRPSHIINHDGVIYVSGMIYRNYQTTGNGSGATYHVIMRYKDSKLEIINIGRDQDGDPATVNDWEPDKNTGIYMYKGVYLYDYLGRTHTQPALAVVGNTLFYTYFERDELNMEGLATIDLSDPTHPVTKLLHNVRFDVLSGMFLRADYWQGNGSEYTIIPAADQKSVVIIDGHENEYQYDIVHNQFKRLANMFGHSYINPGDANFMFLTKGKVHNGVLYFLNQNGIYMQKDYKTRPVIIFNPKEFNWSSGDIGAIADWDIIDDNTVDLLDFTNHQIVRLTLDLTGQFN